MHIKALGMKMWTKWVLNFIDSFHIKGNKNSAQIHFHSENGAEMAKTNLGPQILIFFMKFNGNFYNLRSILNFSEL